MSVLDASAVGVQSPRLSHVPSGPRDYTFADETALPWLAEVVGFDLDEWQRLVLRESLAQAEPWTWAVTEVGLVVPRQNGKGAILEARELVSLFLVGDELLIHSAHEFKTAHEHFLRLRARIEDAPELRGRLHPRRGIRTGSGEQGIELKSGARLRILARSRSSGRGFSAPFVAFDEAMDLPDSAIGAMIPTQSAMPGRQRWYTGSAVDQFEHEHGIVFARVRERGMRGEDPRLAFFEWSLDDLEPGSDGRALDEASVARANPGYGIRIFWDAVEDEANALSARSFDVERRGRGSWPPTDVDADQVIDLEVWNGLADRRSQLDGPVCLAIDTTPDRSWSAIAAAGLNQDGAPHVEVKHNRGTSWVVPRLVEYLERLDVLAVVCGGRSAAASLEPECRDADVELKLLSASDEARAFGLFCDLVEAERLRHLGSEELRSAVKGATKRRLGDAWAWDRRDAAVDISPLVAATLALWESAENGWEDLGDPVIYY